MQLPTLPTDNLYKFQALAGLWLIVLSIGLPSYAMFALKERIIEAERDAQLIEVDERDVETQMRAYSDKLKSISAATAVLGSELDQFHAQRFSSRQEKLAALARMEERSEGLHRETNDATLAAFDERAGTLRRNIVKGTATAARLRLLLTTLERMPLYSVAGLMAGLYLAIRGFRRWHTVQVLSDEIMRRQLPPSDVSQPTPAEIPAVSTTRSAQLEPPKAVS